MVVFTAAQMDYDGENTNRGNGPMNTENGKHPAWDRLAPPKEKMGS